MEYLTSPRLRLGEFVDIGDPNTCVIGKIAWEDDLERPKRESLAGLREHLLNEACIIRENRVLDRFLGQTRESDVHPCIPTLPGETPCPWDVGVEGDVRHALTGLVLGAHRGISGFRGLVESGCSLAYWFQMALIDRARIH